MLGTAGTTREGPALVSTGKKDQIVQTSGLVQGPSAAGGICRRSLGELRSEPAPAFPGLLLPSVASQGIAGRLHTGKEPGSGAESLRTGDPPPLPIVGPGSASAGPPPPGCGTGRGHPGSGSFCPWGCPLNGH